MEEIEKIEDCKFLKSIYGNNIPKDIKRNIRPNGVVVYSVGKPNIRKLVEATLALMS